VTASVSPEELGTAGTPVAALARGELDAWLRLLETPGVGRISARRLLKAFGTPEAVFDAGAARWREVVDTAQVRALGEPPDTLAALQDTTWQWLGEPGHAVIALGDPRYPEALLAAPDPPLLLYASGRIDLLSQPSVAVVGSRNPTPQGSQNARAFAEALSRAGVVVVSGMAVGIDAAAHEGALAGPAGTIAVVGTGLDRVYPKRHLELAHRIAERGVLVSEFSLGTPALQENFPLRNRIIAGLSLGTLVVEAAVQSGSLITARLATDSGREVFAVPGSIHSPLSRGCHALIRQGAKLVETTQDILDELRLQVPGAQPSVAAPPPAAEADPLLEALGFDPQTLEALQARTGWSAADLSVRLLSLEMSGDVERLPGQRFQRVVRA
jgi:DNA processing protein